MSAKRTDANQRAIVAVLRQAGATVTPIHMVGGGCPDLVCGYRGVNYLLECKDGDKPLSAQQLTPDETVWHASWRGAVRIVRNETEALRAIGAID